MKLHNPYSFVIFDWDGTIMDSTDRIVNAMRKSAKNIGLTIPSESDVKGIIGLSMQACMDRLFPQADEEERAALLEEYRFQYVEGDNTPTPLFEGVIESLEWLKSHDILIAVATGKSRVGLERVLREVDLLNYFHSSICADEAAGKPHPEMVQRLMEGAGFKPLQTLVVGDSVHDLHMAKNAGVDAIGVTSGANQHHELDPLSPIAIFENVVELKPWLETRHS
ncbi:HAD-IA family hydrolase [Aliikangiella marina]|uniref:HAD-IA family hydrolase n=1 Tax=Aliikangiella marina TaxID=1712262 RepID=A0A545TJP8_9GAMM|nr:HAD-IA family hydrolase [Aliikangiella marina]TQV77445.1 HAD-IA family hydrolase [Aliikangiella marina]